jgi:hypothetical protein
MALWKGQWQGRERVFLTKAGLVLDGEKLRLVSANPEDLNVRIYPAPDQVVARGGVLKGKQRGLFTGYTVPAPKVVSSSTTFGILQAAGAPREIPLGKIKQPVAAAPEDPDFDKAAVWRMNLPSNLDLDCDPVLKLDYVGDVARLIVNGKFITDDFYNGSAWEIGLRRHAREILKGDLRIAILPLRKDAPIYMAKGARPDFGGKESVAELRSATIVPRYQVELTGGVKSETSTR